MGYHEDRYIDYLGERDGNPFAGEPGRAIQEDPTLFLKGSHFVADALRRARPQFKKRLAQELTTMAKKSVAVPPKKSTPADARAKKKVDKKVARIQKRIDKIDSRINKLSAKKAKLEKKRDTVK